jgi:HD-GYP domain-containing protein (c-di-GMP phosphodiesterase class II)
VSPPDQQPALRAAEVLAALALATDLGTGQPLDRGLRTCLLAMRLGRAIDLDDETLRQIHQFALLRFLGCTSDAAETAAIVAGDDTAFLAAMAPSTMGSVRQQMAAMVGSVAVQRSVPVRVAHLVRIMADTGWDHRSLSTHCEVAVRLGARLGCPSGVLQALAHAYERWDGGGLPDGLAGEDVPTPVRVVTVAGDAVLFGRLGGAEEVTRILTERRGRAHDPAVVDAWKAVGPDELARLDRSPLWEETMAAEPAPHAAMDHDGLDRALTAVADFADLKSPAMRGHSRRVAHLAEGAARWCGLGEAEAAALRRAGLVHDVGRVVVPSWPATASARTGVEQIERERLHPYFTERVLARCVPLKPYAYIAASHHERIDGGGYHRGLRGTQLDTGTRLLAAADMLALITSEQPDSGSRTPEAALRSAVQDGALDPSAADAVIGAYDGGPPRGHHRAPAGLTERETQVLRLLAGGRTNRQIAESLHLSRKTVGRHVDNIYAKTQTHSRAAAAVFALEQGILPD